MKNVIGSLARTFLIVGTFTLLGVVAFSFVECSTTKSHTNETVTEDVTVKTLDCSWYSTYHIVECTYEGETHQFISNGNGLDHWPGCKYCKQKGNGYENN